MNDVILYIAYVVFLLNLTFFVLSLLNILWAYNISNFKNYHSEEFVSVLIPARNESKNIASCIESLLNQSYLNLEIIVVDDNSTDDTFNISEKYLSNVNFSLIKGKSLPDGWLGKNFACHQLQQAAKGNYLLFTDADTVFEMDAISKSLGFIKQKNCDLLSVMPHELTETFWEKTILPMIHFVVYTLLPLKLVENSRDEKFVMANGQFLFFTKDMYNKTGGHSKLRNKIVEDVWFGKEVKKNGGRLIFANGTGIMKCRMYNSFHEIISGFTKNLFPGLSFSTIGLFFVLLTFFAVYILPYIFLLFGIFTQNISIIAISISSIFLSIISRISQAIHFKLPVVYSFIHLLSVVMFIYIGLKSFIQIRTGKGATWKGRVYKESVLRDE